ncbi:sushi, von Willebrand factor type A, EGF and pentraxin domain-containing protein 1-like [Sycon ciliatum]|uniref:sushi, von Willebrand factor type A, EGF and pentraxin domain-containing protein 1-like n=1 Tax=Sycon ciliatum TaxID=27933 RepID=UPI0031F6A1DA
MLSINSQEEQDEVASHVLKHGSWAWFNATDMRTEAVWSQGSTPLKYAHWNFMTSEPNGGREENCASIDARRGGFWLDATCVYTLHVFCERDFLVKYGCGDWSSWSECTVTCGGGTQTKTRRCVFANGSYDDLQPQECSTQQCPGWSAFSAVTPCIVCGAQQGKQLHARKCLLTGVDADNECAESSFDWRDCNEQTTLGCTLMQGVTLAEVPEKTCTDIDGNLTYSLTHRKCMDELNTSVSLDVCRREIVQLCSPIHAQAIGECAKPSDLADGAYHYVASDRVEYVCNHGYKMATNETDNNLHVKKCINGEWIPDTVMSCEPVTCPDVKDILNGDLSVDSAYPEGPLPLHSTVIYSCHNGYEFSDGTKVLTRVCQANGHWSGQQPACEGVSCSEYTAPEHGFLLQPQLKYQHPYTVHIACDCGYARQGLSYSECLSNGLWSDANTPIQCMVWERAQKAIRSSWREIQRKLVGMVLCLGCSCAAMTWQYSRRGTHGCNLRQTMATLQFVQ